MAYIGQGIKQGTFKVLDTSGNTYNGCVEIIDSQGVLGYSTQEECLENCQPDPQYEVWRCVPNGGQDGECICSQTYSPTPATPPINFASEADYSSREFDTSAATIGEGQQLADGTTTVTTSTTTDSNTTTSNQYGSS